VEQAKKSSQGSGGGPDPRLLQFHSAEKQSTFPEQLMEVLSNESLSDIITWLPHGKGWFIRDKGRFEKEVMPLYFDNPQSKYTSFTRKLNRWNFYRVSSGSENGAYYHPLFLRDNKSLCSRMTCSRHLTDSFSAPTLDQALSDSVEQGMVARGHEAADPSLGMRLGEIVSQLHRVIPPIGIGTTTTPTTITGHPVLGVLLRNLPMTWLSHK